MYSNTALATPMSPSQTGMATPYRSSHFRDYPMSRDDRERAEQDVRTSEVVESAIVEQEGGGLMTVAMQVTR